MDTVQTPFFLGLVNDPVRRERAAAFVASRMLASAADPVRRLGDGAYDDWANWLRRIGFWRNHARGGVPGGVDAFLSDVGLAADSRGLVYPGAIHTVYVSCGQQVQRRHARLVLLTLENSSFNRDRALVHDLVDEFGWTHDDCEHCGVRFLTDDMSTTWDDGYVCENCRLDHYSHSEYRDTFIPSDNAVDALDQRGRPVVIHEDDDAFHWCDERDTYVHDDYEPPAPPSIIREYHYSKPYFVARDDAWSRQHNRLLGAELEVECYSCESRVAADRIHQHVNGGTFGQSLFFERDGSLVNGFEMITQPMSLPALRDVFGFLNRPELVEGLRSHRTTTCGLHVHVNRSGLSNLTIARANVFVNDPQNDAFITAIARRYNARFCLVSEKNLETGHVSQDRYEAINLTGRTTIEFRLFKGSLKYEAVVAAIEFSHALLEFCARNQTGAAALNARAFLAFCAKELRDDTAVLRDYAAARTAGVFAHSEVA